MKGMFALLPAILCCGLSISQGVAQSYLDCISPNSDTDGDGYGWENNQTCIVITQNQSTVRLQTQTISNNDIAWYVDTESVSIDDNQAIIARETGTVIYKLENGSWKPSTDLSADTDSARSVSISGDYAVVGVGVDFSTGAALVYESTNGAWAQVSELTLGDGKSFDYFGDVVAMDGEYLVVGAYGRIDDNGAAYVYERLSGGWTLVATLAASDGEQYDRFGQSVAISGNTIVVGAKYNDNSNGYNAGAAYIFERHGGSWTEVVKIIASDGAREDTFGAEVAVSGNRILISSHLADIGGKMNSGAVYVIERRIDTWNEVIKLTAVTPTAFNFFGRAVDLAGNRAVIGARGDSRTAYVLEYNNGFWSQVTELQPSNSPREFGNTVAISADKVMIGCESAGTVYYYKLIPNDECIDEDGDGFGWDGDSSCRATLSTELVDESVFAMLPCIDNDGDGWGWKVPPGRPDLGQSCVVAP